MKFMITIYDNDDSEAAYTGEFREEHRRIHAAVQDELADMTLSPSPDVRINVASSGVVGA